MDAFLIFLVSLGTAYIVSRLTRRGRFGLADLSIGLFSGAVSFGMTQLLSVEGAAWGLSIPLLLACGLTLALEAPRQRPLL